MIYVPRDTVGVRLVLKEVLEREHDIFRVSQKFQGKSETTKVRMMRGVAQVTLSPGFERWAQHLMLLERIHKLGLGLGELLAVELVGLQVLSEVRAEHRYRHPTCYACGLPQENRFQSGCMDCGAEYRKAKGK